MPTSGNKETGQSFRFGEMAYGLRAVSVAALRLDDLDWRHSRVRIQARKGVKEVVLPLMEAVGEALIRYLRHRPARTPFREVFLTTKAPWHPLTSLLISHAVRGYLHQAGVQLPGAGARSLRHSWAIRALAHDTPIKAIADVLGPLHRHDVHLRQGRPEQPPRGGHALAPERLSRWPRVYSAAHPVCAIHLHPPRGLPDHDGSSALRHTGRLAAHRGLDPGGIVVRDGLTHWRGAVVEARRPRSAAPAHPGAGG